MGEKATEGIMEKLIIVGVDGSAASDAAVEWAADDAARMGTALHVVIAVDRQPYAISKFPNLRTLDALSHGAVAALAQAAKTARLRRPDIDVTTETGAGHPGDVLRGQAGKALEIVVGSRGLGGFAGAVMGSVSVQVAGHVPGPVVVVRRAPDDFHGEIVVGVDDSEACEPALAYAFAQAASRGATLRAVHAWQLPVHAYAPDIGYDMDEIRTAQHHVAAEKLQPWRGKYPGVPVIDDVRCAHPVAALTAASATADLVVVGSHGHGAIGSAVLGSVSHGVLHHAHCAIAVVRPPVT
jgi:nucleotide-binding universal stress UspA family protein